MSNISDDSSGEEGADQDMENGVGADDQQLVAAVQLAVSQLEGQSLAPIRLSSLLLIKLIIKITLSTGVLVQTCMTCHN